MIERANLNITSREHLRREIAQQTENFLRHGGSIDVLYRTTARERSVGPVWWDSRGNGPLPLGL